MVRVCAGKGAAIMIICDRRLCVWDQSAECRAMSESLSVGAAEKKRVGVCTAPHLSNKKYPVSVHFPLSVLSLWLLFVKTACTTIKH